MKPSKTEAQEACRRVLRKKKRICYSDDLNQRAYRKRRRSWDSDTKCSPKASLTKIHKSVRPKSTSSMESVVYLGRYKQIPQLVVLDESSDEEKPGLYRRKSQRLRSSAFIEYKDRMIKKTKTRSSLHNEDYLLNMLQEMHVDSTTIKTVTTGINEKK